MKEFVFQRLLLLLLLCPVIQVSGQNDSTTKSKEPDFVNQKFKERRSMFYIAGNSILEGIDDYGISHGIYTAYEHKLNKYHVIGAGVGYYLHYQSFKYFSYDRFDPVFRVDLSYKYFHNLNSRMSMGLTGNNFSANYFYVAPTLSFLHGPHEFSSYAWDFTNGYWVVTTKKSELIYKPSLKIGYGFQRVVRDKMNFDINAGFQINNSMHRYELEKLLFFQIKVGFIIK